MHQASYASLAHIAVLCVQGLDARTYLQSQFTQDVALLTVEQAIYGAVLTPQGKTVSDAWVIQTNDETLFMLHEKSVSNVLLQRMRMFALGHQIKITLQPMMVMEAYYGTAATHLWQGINEANTLASQTQNGVTLLALGEYCWRIANTPFTQKKSWHCMNESEQYARRVLAGSPRFTVDWFAGDYPLNANLRECNGISFDKGCYVGQEISSRMHWRNGIRQSLYHVQLSASPAVYPCDIITTVAIGSLSSCASLSDGSVYGIARLPVAIMNDTQTDSRDLLHTVDGMAVTVLKKTHQ